VRRLLLSLLLIAGPVAAQTAPVAAQTAPRLSVVISPAELTVGDRVEATLTLHAPAALAGDPRFPAWRETWGETEVIAKGEPEKVSEENGTAVWRQKVTLAAFRPGQVPLPPVAVAVPLRERTVEVSTPPDLALQVRSVLPADEQSPEPKPAAPPQALPIGAPFWWTLATLSAILLALLYLIRRQGRAAAEAARPALPPYEELLAELDLAGREASSVAVHTRISLALRHYLARTLSFPAAESTTSEIHRQLLGRHLAGHLVRRAVELLRACDLVKFARQEAGEERVRERLGTAREIGREIDAHLRPPSEEERPEERLEAAG
jgi:hypothetical protein